MSMSRTCPLWRRSLELVVLVVRHMGVCACRYPTPHGFAYCESSSERWVGSPAGQYLSSCPSSIVTWDCASILHRFVSAGPRATTATRPLGHSPAFPHLDARRVYLIDSFIARNPRNNAHTTLLVLTLSGHTFSG